MAMDHSEHVEAFFNQPHLYLDRNPVIALRAQIVRALLGDVQQCNILDLGCGDGSISLQFLSDSNHITLVDLAENMLELARQKIPPKYTNRVSIIQSDLLDFSTGQLYDVILCLGVVAHISTLEAAIKKISELMSSGARCLIQFTDQEQWISRVLFHYYRLTKIFRDTYNYSIKAIKSSELLALTRENSLKLLSQRTYWTILPGFGRLPPPINRKILTVLSGSNFLAKHGGEKIWLMVKET